ncbi:MAG: hypothetical protein DRI94_14880 [Bacteroidetes bacterium]|nr:MAG: hypothetical protein DRI94_14880 [Bacteroidota bacterium]
MKMFEYQKIILKKVSFSKELFKQELTKSHKWLNYIEFNKLIFWATKKFGKIYSDIIFNISNKYVFNYKPNLMNALNNHQFIKIDKT